MRYVFVREIELLGVYMGPRADLFKTFWEGLLKPVVGKVFDLKDAQEAHRYL